MSPHCIRAAMDPRWPRRSYTWHCHDNLTICRVLFTFGASKAPRCAAPRTNSTGTDSASTSRRPVTHYRALPHGEVATAIGKVRAAEPGSVDTLAFEFMVLTAARGAEIRGAVWNEMDQGSGVWTIPASRTKTAREHRVPLCGRAREILEAARNLGGGKNPVFVNERGDASLPFPAGLAGRALRRLDRGRGGRVDPRADREEPGRGCLAGSHYSLLRCGLRPESTHGRKVSLTGRRRFGTL